MDFLWLCPYYILSLRRTEQALMTTDMTLSQTQLKGRAGLEKGCSDGGMSVALPKDICTFDVFMMVVLS